MTARIITNEGAREVSDREFAHAFGLRSRTELDAAYDAKVEWYIERILSGCTFSEYGNPAVREAKELIALRDAEATGDPLPHLEPLRRRA